MSILLGFGCLLATPRQATAIASPCIEEVRSLCAQRIAGPRELAPCLREREAELTPDCRVELARGRAGASHLAARRALDHQQRVVAARQDQWQVQAEYS